MAPTPLTLAKPPAFSVNADLRRLLAQTKNAKERQALLAGKVEDMINTVVRQIAFYSFERAVHTERRNGELTAQRIGEIWLSVQSEVSGRPSRSSRATRRTGWHPALHPFAILRLCLCVRRLPREFALCGLRKRVGGICGRYLDMLSAGGTKHYSELLKPFGLDARDPAFWDGGLSVIESLIAELEAMG
jgi:oligoendopeptidase F